MYVDDQLSERVAAALYLLNQSEAMTSRAEVTSRMTSWMQLRNELMSLRRNVSRISDVTHDTRSRAHDFRVCIIHTSFPGILKKHKTCDNSKIAVNNINANFEI